MDRNNISYEDFNQAVKAAYKLGKMEGEDNVRTQLLEARKLLKDMAVTNKEQWKLLNEEHKTERVRIGLMPREVRNILEILRKSTKGCTPNRQHYGRLKKKYEAATGEKFPRKPQKKS